MEELLQKIQGSCKLIAGLIIKCNFMTGISK